MTRTEIDLNPLLPMGRISATLLAQTASRFESRITLEQESMVLNLKSMLGLLSRLSFGDGRAVLVADGIDELEATQAILAICRKPC